MGSLMSLRSELLRGDLRCLYLGWLLSAQNEEFAEDKLSQQCLLAWANCPLPSVR